MNVTEELGSQVGVVTACRALGVSRATLYRHRNPAPKAQQQPAVRPKSHRALSTAERQKVMTTLDSERFADQAPAEVYATLLDEGIHLCSVRTMYRLLQEHGEVRERRNQLRHPSYACPELLATAPNQLWSWDITKLKGPRKWLYFHLYVILDVYSRYVVGWMVAEHESDTLAKRLIAETIGKQQLSATQRKQLTLHADRGSSMKSKLVAQLLDDLGVTKTHSRPRVSDDNPYSESQFKTMKYRPGFPARFGSIVDARAFGRDFFSWYNNEHHHHGLALLTPHQVHHGLAQAVLAQRQQTLDDAFLVHPERFSRPPKVPGLPLQVWINRPSESSRDPTSSVGDPSPCRGLPDPDGPLPVDASTGTTTGEGVANPAQVRDQDQATEMVQ
jgi:putative transposase